MAAAIVSGGYKLAAKLRKAKNQIYTLAEHGAIPADQVETRLDQARTLVMREHKEAIELGLDAAEMFKEAMMRRGYSTTNWYHITISPPPGNFRDFYEAIKRLTERCCFKEFTLSFEQRGTDLLQMGTGYHCHIVANMTQRSKGEVIRDLGSSLKNVCAQHFIQVDPTRNPGDIVTNYLIEYRSKDEHKEPLKEWDAKWRQQMGIEPIYTGPLPSLQIMRITPPLCESVSFD